MGNTEIPEGLLRTATLNSKDHKQNSKLIIKTLILSVAVLPENPVLIGNWKKHLNCLNTMVLIMHTTHL